MALKMRVYREIYLESWIFSVFYSKKIQPHNPTSSPAMQPPSTLRPKEVAWWIGMPIPQQVSFLEDSGNRGMAIFHYWGIGESKSYSPGSSGNFGELSFLLHWTILHNKHYT
jgi:hypothetical protein